MSDSLENDRRSYGSVNYSFSINWKQMNNARKFYAITQPASELLSSTIFEDRFPPYAFFFFLFFFFFFFTVLSKCIVILTNKRSCLSFYG